MREILTKSRRHGGMAGFAWVGYGYAAEAQKAFKRLRRAEVNGNRVGGKALHMVGLQPYCLAGFHAMRKRVMGISMTGCVLVRSRFQSIEQFRQVTAGDQDCSAVRCGIKPARFVNVKRM